MSSGDTLSLHEVPKRSSILDCFSGVGRSIHRDTLSSQESQNGTFLHGFAKANSQVRTILVDTCCPVSGSSSTFFHPFAANSRTTCAVASQCSGFLNPSLCQRHCATQSSNESGVWIFVPDCQSVCQESPYPFQAECTGSLRTSRKWKKCDRRCER